jgi:hypothetical protein
MHSTSYKPKGWPNGLIENIYTLNLFSCVYIENCHFKNWILEDYFSIYFTILAPKNSMTSS